MPSTTNSEAVLEMAALNLEAKALREAALMGDLNEGCFRASNVAKQAIELGFDAIGAAATEVLATLGPPDNEPAPGYGAAMFRLRVLMDPSR